MDAAPSLKSIVRELYPLHRTLVSDGTDEALEIIGGYLPDSANYSQETYTPGEKVWTWIVPDRYVVHEAYFETERGQRIVDFEHNPLHLVSYSLATDCTLKWDDLQAHLYYSEKRPTAIPWEFKYYERGWGFCLSKRQFEELSKDEKYHVVIRSEFKKDPDKGLRIGVAMVHPEGGHCKDSGEILLCSHVCHPYQANDDIAGAVTMLEVAKRFTENPLPQGSMSIRFLFCPETIGSICYLSHHEDLIPNFRGAIFCEMTGNQNIIALQRSRQDNHLMDRIARYVLKRRNAQFREGAFREIIGNDEMVINGPGVNIPCISLSRWPYDEYHTSDDNPDIIVEDMLQESADIIEEIIRIFASNSYPCRVFRGPIFLSGYGLWVDWRVNPALNAALEKIMLKLEGTDSIFAISESLNLDYWEVYKYIREFFQKNLITLSPRPITAKKGK